MTDGLSNIAKTKGFESENVRLGPPEVLGYGSLPVGTSRHYETTSGWHKTINNIMSPFVLSGPAEWYSSFCLINQSDLLQRRVICSRASSSLCCVLQVLFRRDAVAYEGLSTKRCLR
jgi:hypothetical protein